MDEYFLQYLWKFQRFHLPELQLTDGQPLVVFSAGHQNADAGPDFREARIRIGDLIWSGSVEVHYRSSDWKRHTHDTDLAYENVILHVVWTHDEEILLNGTPIPTLELASRVKDTLEHDYRKYMSQPETIRCQPQLATLPDIQLTAMKDRALADRLQQKSSRVLQMLEATGGDWEETTYRLLARNFGFKINGFAFDELAESLPHSILRKHHRQPVQISALLFGMSGLLSPVDDFSHQLHQEFRYLAGKYQLQSILDRHQWKFARLRPANFPTMRIAQLAAVLTAHQQLFSTLKHADDLSVLYQLIRQPVLAYWETHYDFGKPTAKTGKLGVSSLENIIINTAVPVLAAYAGYIGEQSYLDKAIGLLEQLPAEQNHVIREWQDAGVGCSHAGDSQALIHQLNEFCMKKRCLHCNIGIQILNRS